MVDCQTPTMRPCSTPSVTLSTGMSLMPIKVVVRASMRLLKLD